MSSLNIEQVSCWKRVGAGGVPLIPYFPADLCSKFFSFPVFMPSSIWFKLEYNLAKNSNGNLGGKIRLIEGNAKCRHLKK